MRSFFAGLLCVALLLPLCCLGVGAQVGDDTKFTMEKTTFVYGEPILVTPYGSGNSWIGIAKTGEESNGSVRWKYIADGVGEGAGAGAGSGETVDIRTGQIAGGRDALADIAPGDWTIFWVEAGNADGYDRASAIEITVTGYFSLEKTVFAQGEPILVKPLVQQNDRDWIGISEKCTDGVGKKAIRWRYIKEGVWYTSDTDGSIGLGLGESFDLRQSYSPADKADMAHLPAGEYTIYYVADNQSADKAVSMSMIDITVSGGPPEAPTALSYDLADETTGLAGGTVTVTVGEAAWSNAASKPTHVILYWGDQNGKLADHIYIGVRKLTGLTTVITLPDAMVIPENATRLLAYCYNGQGVSAGCVAETLPENRTKTVEKGAPVSSFQIVSDVHSNPNSSTINHTHIQKMFADIQALDPDSLGIFVSGDAITSGMQVEYDYLWAHWKNSGLSVPLYISAGNHEYKPGTGAGGVYGEYEPQKNLFIENINKFLEEAGQEPITNGKPYYDLWVGGFHYIFLSTEYAGTHAYLSDAQLAFLDETLAEGRDADRPTFILLHQGLYNTVAGTMPDQKWNGVIAGDANWAAWQTASGGNVNNKLTDAYEQPLRDILKKYPEAMVFSGHSHWDVTSEHNIYEPTHPTDATNALPNYLFNTGGVAELWSDIRVQGGEYQEGSRGYYVRVYENCIELYGRDFANGKWVPNAMYRIALDDFEVHTHAGAYACSDVCATCDTEITPTAGHESDHACDATCKHCGQEVVTATAEHRYDSLCDVDCNVCNEQRTVEEHIGAYDCSENCKHCGYPITPAAQHTGTYTCSDSCTVCGASLMSDGHVGAHNCSEQCRYCGTAIVAMAEHAWNDGEVTTAPTTEAEGEKTFTCTVCGTTKVKSVAKLPASPAPDSSEGDNDTVNDGSTTDNNNAGNGGQADIATEQGLPAGAIVAIVLGAAALLGVGGFCLWRFVLRKKK